MSRKTAGVVAVKNGKITPEAIGLIQKKANDACRRVEKGALTLPEVLEGFQAVLDNILEAIQIKVGTQKSLKSLHKTVDKAGARFSYRAEDIFYKIVLTKVMEVLNLVIISVKDLGFPEGASREEIYKAAKVRGWELCPAEIGPLLACLANIIAIFKRLKIIWLVVAMEPIIDSGGYPRVFYLGRSLDDIDLSTVYADPDGFFKGGLHFVFVARK